MGAAIPHLMQLALSLPPILPYPQDEIHTDVMTGTVEVQDELIPEDDEEDVSYRTRGKSTVSIVIRVGDGVDGPAGDGRNNVGRNRGAAAGGTVRHVGNQDRRGTARGPEKIVIREEDMDET